MIYKKYSLLRITLSLAESRHRGIFNLAFYRILDVSLRHEIGKLSPLLKLGMIFLTRPYGDTGLFYSEKEA